MRDFETGLCWVTIHRASLVETIEIAARHGFASITVAPHIYQDSLAEGLTGKDLRRRLRDAGVRVAVIDCIQTGLPGMAAGSIEFAGKTIPKADAEACFRAAEALEASVVNLTHYSGDPVPAAQLAEAVGAIARQAAPRGLEIVLEFVPDTSIGSLGVAHTIARSCGEPNCSILLDTWHLARTGGTVADIEALPPGAIGAFQLSDRIEPLPGEAYVPLSGRKLPGEGKLPLAEIVSAALANNPDISVQVEVLSEELRALTPDAAAARIAAALRKWQAGLGGD